MRHDIGLVWQQVKAYFELENIPPHIWKLVVVLFGLGIIILALFASSIFFKLGESTRYSISTNSEYFDYLPIDTNASDILIRNYSLDPECNGTFGDINTNDAVLILGEGSQLAISRYADGVINLFIISEGEGSVGPLESDEYHDLEPCLQIRIKLDHAYPIFSMNLIGTINLGKELTDASDGYFPMLMGGKIGITDTSILTRSPYQLEPYQLTKGNFVYFEKTKSAVKGILRATYNQSGMDGVFFFQGGNVFVQKYRSPPEKVEVSFLNRISSDSELAILFSVLIVVIQFVAYLISFLLRVKLIDNKDSSYED